MRTIKFRAWHKQRKEMLPVIDIEYLMTQGSLITNYKDFVDNIYPNIMQFTGLLDKNGVEIYEGDILRTKNKKVQEVIFMNGFFQMPEFFIDETDEVIGNIYEHYNLLEANHV